MYSATEYGLCTMKPTVRHVQPPMGQIKVNLYKDVAAGRLQCISVIQGLNGDHLRQVSLYHYLWPVWAEHQRKCVPLKYLISQ